MSSGTNRPPLTFSGALEAAEVIKYAASRVEGPIQYTHTVKGEDGHCRTVTFALRFHGDDMQYIGDTVAAAEELARFALGCGYAFERHPAPDATADSRAPATPTL